MTNNRIAGFDLSRALAFLGMLLINFWAMIRENNGPEWLNFLYGLIQGRAAATFVVLAGVGLSLTFMRYMGGGVDGIQACRHRLFKRAFFLFGLGMVDSIIWPADIIHFYAIYIAIGATLLTASYKRLCLLCILSVAAFSALMMLVHFDRGSDPWVSGFYAFWNLKKMVGHLFFWGNYPVFPWLTFLVIGMWVGRHAGAKTWRMKLLFLGIGAILFSEIISWMAFQSSFLNQAGLCTENVLFWFTLDPWEPMPLFVVSAGGSAFVVISLSTMIAEKLKDARWLAPVLAVGQTTLTLYVAHIFLGGLLMVIMGRLKSETPFFPIWGTTMFFTLSAWLSYKWLKRHQKGPLEWLLYRFLEYRFKWSFNNRKRKSLTLDGPSIF